MIISEPKKIEDYTYSEFMEIGAYNAKESLWLEIQRMKSQNKPIPMSVYQAFALLTIAESVKDANNTYQDYVSRNY